MRSNAAMFSRRVQLEPEPLERIVTLDEQMKLN
jgi:hypothetical protein